MNNTLPKKIMDKIPQLEQINAAIEVFKKTGQQTSVRCPSCHHLLNVQEDERFGALTVNCPCRRNRFHMKWDPKMVAQYKNESKAPKQPSLENWHTGMSSSPTPSRPPENELPKPVSGQDSKETKSSGRESGSRETSSRTERTKEEDESDDAAHLSSTSSSSTAVLSRVLSRAPTPSPRPRQRLLTAQDPNALTLRQLVGQAVQLDVLGTEAWSQGDCFFDSIAQALEAKSISIPGRPQDSGCKRVRVLCRKYMRNDQNAPHPWVKEAMNEDATRGAHPDDYLTCLTQIEYTHDEIEAKKQADPMYRKWQATWGRTAIEGRMISQFLNVKLCVIDVLVPQKGQEAISTLTLSPVLIYPNQEKPEQFNFQQMSDRLKKELQDPRTIFLINYKGHFVPLLKRYVPEASTNVSEAKATVQPTETKTDVHTEVEGESKAMSGKEAKSSSSAVVITTSRAATALDPSAFAPVQSQSQRQASLATVGSMTLTSFSALTLMPAASGGSWPCSSFASVQPKSRMQASPATVGVMTLTSFSASTPMPAPSTAIPFVSAMNTAAAASSHTTTVSAKAQPQSEAEEQEARKAGIRERIKAIKKKEQEEKEKREKEKALAAQKKAEEEEQQRKLVEDKKKKEAEEQEARKARIRERMKAKRREEQEEKEKREKEKALAVQKKAEEEEQQRKLVEDKKKKEAEELEVRKAGIRERMKAIKKKEQEEKEKREKEKALAAQKKAEEEEDQQKRLAEAKKKKDSCVIS